VFIAAIKAFLHWCNSRSHVISDTICHALPPPRSQKVTMNGFKDCRLAPQITTSLSDVLSHHLHAAWETSWEVTHYKISLQHASLTMELLRVGFPKRKVHLRDINSCIKSFKPLTMCYSDSPLSFYGHILLLKEITGLEQLSDV